MGDSSTILYIIVGVTELLGLASLVMTLVLIMEYLDGFSWDRLHRHNWHTFLMVLGMPYLCGNSIMVYKALPSLDEKKAMWIHALLHTLVVPCLIVGLIAGWKDDMSTIHAWVGMSTVLLFMIQWFVSLIAYLIPQMPASFKDFVMKWHLFFGLLTFILSVGSSVTGLCNFSMYTAAYDFFGNMRAERILVNCLALTLILFGTFVVYLTTDKE